MGSEMCIRDSTMDDKMNDVINEVQKKLGEEYEVKSVEVMKNNDT